MNKSYINELEKHAKFILKTGNEKKPYWMLAKYNCSEVSRLLGIKVFCDLGEISKPFILKGSVTKNGISKDNIHDILGFFDSALNELILVDPTIWQFFPKKRSIFLGKFKTLDEAILFTENLYEGKWNFSEYLDKKELNVGEMRGIIKLNCNQAPEWEG